MPCPTVQLHSSQAAALSGEVNVPGDKSISHRAIILAAIAKGTSTISGFLASDDCMATLNAFRQMGVSITCDGATNLQIEGKGKWGLTAPEQPLQLGNSGTSMRLLAGLLAAQRFDTQLIGDKSLSTRPMRRITEPLNSMGATIRDCDGHAPLLIRGGSTLVGISYQMPVASAQIKSCLLLAGLYASGQTQVVEPRITRDHTERMLAQFSYPLTTSKQTVSLTAKGELQATSLDVPACLSSASFFIVAACLVPGSDIVLKNIGVNPTRTGVLKILAAMGACIELDNARFLGGEEVADIHVRYAPLKGIVVPLEWVSLAIDEFPILFLAASCASGETVIRGAKELRVKESDRIAVMAAGLSHLGAKITTLDDGAIINGGDLGGGQVSTQGDHRIAMAFVVAGAIASGPIIIEDCANITTSYPNFIKAANEVGMNVSVAKKKG